MKIDGNNTAIQSTLNQHKKLSRGSANKLLDVDKSRDIKLRQTSKDLEANFITQMFKVMEKTIPKSGLAGSENSLSSMMFSSVMGEALSNQGGIGLSDIIYRSLREKNELPELDKILSDPMAHHAQAVKLTSLEGEE